VALDVEPKLIVHVDAVLGPVVLHHEFNHAWGGFEELFPGEFIVR